jgi:predicted pyridoxine 5'-phosphate oxidase superfamily flavin-nucleotide-binding protein
MSSFPRPTPAWASAPIWRGRRWTFRPMCRTCRRNIVRDPRAAALLFLIPGVGNTLRVNGRAHLSVEPSLLASFEIDGKPPRSVMVMQVDAISFQCARALVRSELWNPAHHVDPKALPSAGQILAALSHDRVGGDSYDRDWPGRAADTLW